MKKSVDLCTETSHSSHRHMYIFIFILYDKLNFDVYKQILYFNLLKVVYIFVKFQRVFGTEECSKRVMKALQIDEKKIRDVFIYIL